MEEGSRKFRAPFSLWQGKLMGTTSWDALHLGRLIVPNWWPWPSAQRQGGRPPISLPDAWHPQMPEG